MVPVSRGVNQSGVIIATLMRDCTSKTAATGRRRSSKTITEHAGRRITIEERLMFTLFYFAVAKTIGVVFSNN